MSPKVPDGDDIASSAETPSVDIPSVGRFSAAHGNAKQVGTDRVFEAIPDGVHDAAPVDAVPQPPRVAGRFTSASASAAARRKHALAKLPDFAKSELEFIPSAEFAPFDSGRRGLISAKAAELVKMTDGEIGAGVMTVIRGWAAMVALSEFYFVKAATTDSERYADRARQFAKDASIELSKAHELARAEAAARALRKPNLKHRLAERQTDIAAAREAAEAAPWRRP